MKMFLVGALQVESAAEQKPYTYTAKFKLFNLQHPYYHKKKIERILFGSDSDVTAGAPGV